MKTYNSYEEAKIANPESNIYELDGVFQPGHMSFREGESKCNPADHCMTVERFLADGHKFVEGDLILDEGLVYLVSDLKTQKHWYETESANQPDCDDNSRYILRAAALNKPKRVKFEYVPINNGNELITYRNELFFKHDSGDYVWTENHTMRSILTHMDNDNLFRRIETETTERDEFIEAYALATHDEIGNIDIIAGMLFDSGKFKLVGGE